MGVGSIVGGGAKLVGRGAKAGYRAATHAAAHESAAAAQHARLLELRKRGLAPAERAEIFDNSPVSPDENILSRFNRWRKGEAAPEGIGLSHELHALGVRNQAALQCVEISQSIEDMINRPNGTGLQEALTICAEIETQCDGKMREKTMTAEEVAMVLFTGEHVQHIMEQQLITNQHEAERLHEPFAEAGMKALEKEITATHSDEYRIRAESIQTVNSVRTRLESFGSQPEHTSAEARSLHGDLLKARHELDGTADRQYAKDLTLEADNLHSTITANFENGGTAFIAAAPDQKRAIMSGAKSTAEASLERSNRTIESFKKIREDYKALGLTDEEIEKTLVASNPEYAAAKTRHTEAETATNLINDPSFDLYRDPTSFTDAAKRTEYETERKKRLGKIHEVTLHHEDDLREEAKKRDAIAGKKAGENASLIRLVDGKMAAIEPYTHVDSDIDQDGKNAEQTAQQLTEKHNRLNAKGVKLEADYHAFTDSGAEKRKGMVDGLSAVVASEIADSDLARFEPEITRIMSADPSLDRTAAETLLDGRNAEYKSAHQRHTAAENAQREIEAATKNADGSEFDFGSPVLADRRTRFDQLQHASQTFSASLEQQAREYQLRGEQQSLGHNRACNELHTAVEVPTQFAQENATREQINKDATKSSERTKANALASERNKYVTQAESLEGYLDKNFYDENSTHQKLLEQAKANGYNPEEVQMFATLLEDTRHSVSQYNRVREEAVKVGGKVEHLSDDLLVELQAKDAILATMQDESWDDVLEFIQSMSGNVEAFGLQLPDLSDASVKTEMQKRFAKPIKEGRISIFQLLADIFKYMHEQEAIKAKAAAATASASGGRRPTGGGAPAGGGTPPTRRPGGGTP